MPRYIRYLENNEWKYASVKTVGDLALLKTDNKEDVVSAINSLIDGGILEVVQDKIDQVQSDVDVVASDVQSQSQTIQNQQELIDLLNQEQESLSTKADELKAKQDQVVSDLDEAKTELLQKADIDYVDGQLVKKVDASVHQQKYDEIESELREKVNLEQYQQEYAGIVESLEQKANSIDLQSVVDNVNEDITNQTIEVDKAKTDIINLDTKVDNTKSEILTTIETVQADADALDAKVAQQKTDLESKITATQTKATNDLATAKTELNNAIGTVQSDVDTLEGTVSSNKQELINKINADVTATNELIEEVEDRVSQAETNITNANTEISNAKQSITNTQTDLATTKQNLTNVQNDLAGTKTDLSNTKTDLQGKINTANQSITNLSNSVDTKIGTVNSDIESLKTRASGIEGDITTINQEIDETKGELSTTITNLSNVDGRLAEAETKVTQNAEGLTTKVSQDAYNVDKQATDERLSTAETTIEQHSESISLKAEKTDVYNKTETDSKLGSKLDTQTFNNKVSEIKVTTDGISQNVSNLQQTTNGHETRLHNAETAIDQNAEQIALKASQEDFDSLSGDVQSAQAELLIQAGKIASKVEKTEHDALEGRVTNQQATVEQLADSITQKVEYSDYDELTQQVSTQETSILQTASQVEILATKSEDIDGRLTSAEASITTQAGQIALKATQSEMDTVKGRVTKAEGDITTQAGQIALKASQSEMDTLTGRVSTAEGKITTQAGQINLKAEKSDVYTKNETDTKLGSKVDSSVYNNKMAEIDLTTDGITQRVTATEGEIDNATGEITNLKTDVSTLEQTATQIQTTVSGIQDDVEGIDGRLSTAETQVTQNKNAIALKASQTDMDTVTGRVDDAEAQLEVQAGQISSKVEKTTYTTDKTAMQNDINSKAKQSDLSALTTRVTTAESNITQTAEAITSKVEQSDFDTLSGTVETQGTTIAQHSNQIALKAEASNVYTKGETDNKLGSKVDNTTYNNKMAEIKLTTDGINQEVTNVKGTVNTQTGQITQLDQDISTVDQKADSIQQQVTSISTTVDEQGETISSQGTSITQLNQSIDLKAEKKDVYTKTEADGKINTAVSSAKSEIQVTTDGIKQDVSKINTTLGDHDSRLVNQQSSIEQLADSISQKVEYSEYDQTTQQMAVQETEILQTKSDITLLANRTSESEDRLSVAEASIQINADAIESKVEQSDFDTLEGTVTTQGTTIAQHASSIALKAEASNVYTKGEADSKLSGKVDNSTYNNKVAQIELDIDGITQEVSDISNDLGTTKQNVSTVTQKANSIEQSVSSLSDTVDEQGRTISSQGTSITQLNSSIALKAEASNVYTKTEADNKVSTAVNNAKAEIKVTTDGISQSVSNVDSKINNMQIGAGNILRNTAIKKDASYFSLGAGVTRDTSFLNKGLNTFKYDVSGLTGDAWRSANPTLIEAKEGEVFSASAEVYIPTGHGIDGSAPTLEMQFYKADGTRISALATATSKPNLSKLDQWQKVTTENITAPAGTVKANARVWLQRNGKLWVSHLMMVRGTRVTDWSPSFLDTDAQFDSVNQSISNVDQKADSISQTVSSLSTTVDGQGTRISNAETTIGQHTTSINLKANATDVYKKTEVDSKLGGKLDTTTYNNKMSSIDIDINGIKQTASNQQTTINDIDGTVSSHTSQISTLDQRADGFDLTVQEVQNDIGGLEGRVSTAETQITANKDAITLKASAQSVSDLGTRVGTAEGKIEVNANQIAQRVTKTEMDNAVGVNKWVASRYDVNLGSAGAIPIFAHIKGKTPVSVIDYADNSRLQPFTGDGYIGHYFTNIYMNTAKTVNLSVTNDDGASIFLNGGSIMARGSATSALPVAVAFRAGWNTLEILHHEYSGGESVQLGLKLSDNVDKMTSVIGVGDKNETRLTQAETSIIQNASDIALRATKTEVTAMGNRISDAEASITLHTDQINSKVSQTDFNAYSQKLTTAESDIVQLKDEITQKVSTTDYNLLNNTVKDQQTLIQQLNESISLKVDEQIIDGLDQRITDSETQISLTQDSILLKAEKTELDEVTGRLSDAEASIELQADQITQRVTKTEFDALSVGGRNLALGTETPKTATGTGGTNQTTNLYDLDFSLVAGKEITISFDAVSTASGKLIVQWSGTPWGYLSGSVDVGTTKKHFSKTVTQPTDGTAKSIQARLDGLNGAVTISNLKIEFGNKETTWTPAVEDIKGDLTALGQRMTSAETSITQTAEAITLKADKATTYTKSEIDGQIDAVELQISNQGTQIQQTNEAITLKANKTDVYTKTEAGNLLAGKTDNSTFNALVTRVTNAESSLTVANDNIATKVAQTTFDVLNDKVSLNTDSTNYNPNPSFEGKKNTYYTNATAFASTDAGVPTGAPKSYVGRQTSRDNYISDFFSVKEGDKFIVEGWIASTDSAQNFGLGLNTQDNAGTNLWLVSGHMSKGAGTWQYFKQVYTIPAGKTKARFFSQINASSSYGNWYFTDVRVTKVTPQSQVDGLETKLTAMQTTIDQTSSDITLKANKSDVYTKSEADGKVTTAVNDAKASIKITTDSIASDVATLESTTTTQGQTLSSHSTSISQLNSSITSKAEKTDVYTKTEADGKISTAVTNAKSEIKQTTDSITSTVTNVSNKVDGISVGGRNLVLGTATAKSITGTNITNQTMNIYNFVGGNSQQIMGKEITVTFDWKVEGVASPSGTFYMQGSNPYSMIADRVTLSSSNMSGSYSVTRTITGNPFTAVNMRLDNVTSGAKITISNFMIQFGNKPTGWSPAPEDVSGQMDSMASQIKQTADEVSINVVKKDGVLASINASSEGVKIQGSKVDIEGQVTFSSFDNSTQERITATESKVESVETSTTKNTNESGISSGAKPPTFKRATTRDYKGRTYGVDEPVYDMNGLVVESVQGETLNIPTDNAVYVEEGTIETAFYAIEAGKNQTLMSMDYSSGSKMALSLTSTNQVKLSIGSTSISTLADFVRAGDTFRVAIKWSSATLSYSLFINGVLQGIQSYDKNTLGNINSGETIDVATDCRTIIKGLRISKKARLDKELA